MKKRIGLTLAVGLMASLPSMQAAIVPCAFGENILADLIALGAGPGNGCTTANVLFNNFNYTPGSGAPSAGNVEGLLSGDFVHLTDFGWIFTPLTFPFEFQGNFTVGFTVTVLPDPTICPTTCPITSTDEELVVIGTGSQAITVSYTPAQPVVSLNNLTSAGTIGGVTISPGVTSLTRTATTTGISAADPLIGFLSRVSATVVPEPATMELIGAGLLGLSLLRRQQRKS